MPSSKPAALRDFRIERSHRVRRPCRIQERFLLVAIPSYLRPKLTASGHQSGKFRAGQRLRLLSLSHPVAGVVASVLGVHIDGLAGIGNSRTSLLSLLQRILFDVGCASVGLRLGWISV